MTNQSSENPLAGLPVYNVTNDPPPRRRRGNFWVYCGGCVVLMVCIMPCLCFGLLSALISVAESNETIREQVAELPVESDIVTVRITNDFGKVEVVGENRNNIRIEAVRRGWGLTGSAARNNLEDVEVNIRQSGSATEIVVDDDRFQVGDWGFGFVDLRIRVPAILNLDIQGGFGGVTVSGVEIQQTLEITSNFGEISFAGALTAPEGVYLLESRVGTITVGVREDSQFVYETRSERGQVTVELELQDEVTLEDGSGTYGNAQTQARLKMVSEFGNVILRNN